MCQERWKVAGSPRWCLAAVASLVQLKDFWTGESWFIMDWFRETITVAMPKHAENVQSIGYWISNAVVAVKEQPSHSNVIRLKSAPFPTIP